MTHFNDVNCLICFTVLIVRVVAQVQNQQLRMVTQNAGLYYINHRLNKYDNQITTSDERNIDKNRNNGNGRYLNLVTHNPKNDKSTAYTEIIEQRDEEGNNIAIEDASLNENCNISVENTSIRYFQNILIQSPYLIKFKVVIKGKASVRSLNSTFKPLLWFWTPNTTVGPYPFLSWKIDYGMLAFGLLDTNTRDIPFINLHVKGNCNFTFGTNDTSHRLTKAFGQMLNFSDHHVEVFPFSYFCYMHVHEELINTTHYYASLYIIFPIKFVSYKCCAARKNFNKTEMEFNCTDETTISNRNWDQISILPFFVGILILAFCPIPISDVCAWLTKHENNSQCGEAINEHYENIDKWVFENGTSPLTFFDLLSFSVFGLDISHPVLASRLRRLLVLLLIPCVIYFQLFMYRNGIGMSETDKIKVEELVDIGAPMGFLSIYGNPSNRGNVFVPYLWGPVGLVIIYFSLGIIFIVLPRHLKQIFEDGLPSGGSMSENDCNVRNKELRTPLLFWDNDIIKLSRVNVTPEQMNYGYTKVATLMRCSIYMLFTTTFWSAAFKIQKNRISSDNDSIPIYKKAILIFFIPFYVVVCALEACCCILYYGFPCCFLVVVVVKGASKALANLRDQIGCASYGIIEVLGVVIVFILAAVFSYTISLVFLKSFIILSQILVLCFISIIIFPTVSFGYIFFFTASLYFCFHQIRNFGEVYASLLSTAIEVSDRMEGYSNNVSFHDNKLILTNVRYENITDVRINGKLLDVSQNVLRTVHLHGNSKVREVNNTMGIPKKLFDHLVHTYRPVHQQVLSLIFKVFAMAALIIVTLSITSDYVKGPTSEISEVMHVIFIIAAGALPELIEVTVSYRDDEHVKKEIEERKMEETIKEFWRHN